MKVNKNRKKKGFTIVELIIVIAVIGVLAAILIPTFANVIKKANLKSAYSDAKNQLTMLVSSSDGADETGANVLDDTVFVVHKAGKLYFFQYRANGGSLEETAIEPVPCNADQNDTNYDELIEAAANSVISVKIRSGEIMGGSRPLTSNSDDERLSNIKLYPGSIVEDLTAVGTYFSTITPLATLQSQTATVTNSEGDTVSAIRLDSERDLYSLANYINNGSLSPNTSIKLAKDMFMGSVEWTPIGGNGLDFTGTFDGDGHMIYDLHSRGTVELPFEFGGATIDFGGCALFGSTYYDYVNNGPSSMIKNVSIANSTSDASPAAAALAIYGYNVVVENVRVYGTIKAPTNVGGIFWYSTSAVLRNCIVEADLVTTSSASSSLLGGMVAQSSGYIQFLNCEYSGTIRQTEDAMTVRCFAGYIVAYCYEYDNYFQSFTVGLNSRIIGNAANAAFTGEDFEGNIITNNVPLLKHSDGLVYATYTNLFGYRAFAGTSPRAVDLYNLGI